MSDGSAHFIGSIPEHYDRGLGPILFEDFAAGLTARAASLPANRTLELAAGTGIVSRKLRDALPAKAGLMITDLNPPMLEIARQKFGDKERVEFEPADAMELPFEDEYFDLVVCQFGVMFFPDKAKAFGEVRRVLKPGGNFLFNAWGTMDECSYSTVIYGVGETFFPDNPPTFYQVPFSYPDIEKTMYDLRSGGFELIDHEIVDQNKVVPNWTAFSTGLVLGNPLIEEIEQRGTVSAQQFIVAVASALESTFGAAPASIPLRATVYRATR